MYPNDAITVVQEINGNTTWVVTNSGNYTILAVAMQQENVASNTIIQCGSNIVAKNYATNFSNVTMNYQCQNKVIQVVKTGNDHSTVIITYVPYLTNNYATTTEAYNPVYNIASSSDVKIYGSITAGEVLIISLILIGLLFKSFELMARGLSGLRLKRRFLRYNGGDVPMDDE